MLIIRDGFKFKLSSFLKGEKMLKTYRIIPLVFILFLFGFTLITVSPVIAEDSSEFVACQQIKPRGNFRLDQ